MVAVGAKSLSATIKDVPVENRAPAFSQRLPDVVVVGAGVIGGFTAYHLQNKGARVLQIDAYGPGNSRSTSGDETRGIRTSYGDRPHGEQWMQWADQSIQKWKEWDDRWWKEMGQRVFFETGDLITRGSWDPFLTTTATLWEKNRIAFERLTVDEAQYRWPVFNLEGIQAALYEPQAGVVRARASVICISSQFQRGGGKQQIERVTTLMRDGGKIDHLLLGNGEAIRGGKYVFALGPWMWKMFSALLQPRMRAPMGHVFYVATPVGDSRFQYPNMPSHNFPGITGWPTLPFDNRGFRTRVGGGASGDPDTSVRMVPPSNHERLRRFLAERFPLIKDMPVSETRACHYESTVSRNFIIDTHPDFSNAWLAGGGNAEAFKQGPVFGEYVANRVLGRPTDPALTIAFKVPETTYELEEKKAAEAAAARKSGEGDYDDD